jgi:UDP-N-acetylglucosamine 2-epimerase (non-hydrolysing)
MVGLCDTVSFHPWGPDRPMRRWATMTHPISKKHPVAVVVGTRPEAIKLAPVLLALRERGVPTVVLSTGQHREMLQQVFDAFGLKPDRDLDLMVPNQTLAGLSARIMEHTDRVFEELQPSWAVVQGDTSTVAVVAWVSFYRKIGVAHVEAGLRTHNKYNPFPEEMNRTLVGNLADLHFAPTEDARKNLLAQGVAADDIHVVGNTVIDALRQMREIVKDKPFAEFGLPADLENGKKLILVTGHRRENFGPAFRDFCTGLLSVAKEFEDRVELVYPVHLNPNVQSVVYEMMDGVSNVRLMGPLAYPQFVKMLSAAHLVITDSGGVQEESACLGVPVLVTRETCERREAIDAGVAELVGTNSEKIASSARLLLTDEAAYRSRAVPSDVFGDGRAAKRIAEILAGEMA